MKVYPAKVFQSSNTCFHGNNKINSIKKMIEKQKKLLFLYTEKAICETKTDREIRAIEKAISINTKIQFLLSELKNYIK